MASLQISSKLLVAQVTQIHASISKLRSLRPSKQVNSLFSKLVKLCILPISIDIATLPEEVQAMRESLIDLCGHAESILELEFAMFLIKIPQPLNNLNLFPYYVSYVKLANIEYRILHENGVVQPKKVAFVGSGPMPLTSFILATYYMKFTHFDNFDIDEVANDVAHQLVATDAELEKRMKFVTCDILEVKEKLSEYDCIFLAALVGKKKADKVKIIGHIRKYMKAGGVLLVRSAKGARAFLYPVIEEQDVLGFELLSIFHPVNDVINSVVLLRKLWRNDFIMFNCRKEVPPGRDSGIWGCSPLTCNEPFGLDEAEEKVPETLTSGGSHRINKLALEKYTYTVPPGRIGNFEVGESSSRPLAARKAGPSHLRGGVTRPYGTHEHIRQERLLGEGCLLWKLMEETEVSSGSDSATYPSNISSSEGSTNVETVLQQVGFRGALSRKRQRVLEQATQPVNGGSPTQNQHQIPNPLVQRQHVAPRVSIEAATSIAPTEAPRNKLRGKELMVKSTLPAEEAVKEDKRGHLIPSRMPLTNAQEEGRDALLQGRQTFHDGKEGLQAARMYGLGSLLDKDTKGWLENNMSFQMIKGMQMTIQALQYQAHNYLRWKAEIKAIDREEMIKKERESFLAKKDEEQDVLRSTMESKLGEAEREFTEALEAKKEEVFIARREKSMLESALASRTEELKEVARERDELMVRLKESNKEIEWWRSIGERSQDFSNHFKLTQGFIDASDDRIFAVLADGYFRCKLKGIHLDISPFFGPGEEIPVMEEYWPEQAIAAAEGRFLPAESKPIAKEQVVGIDIDGVPLPPIEPVDPLSPPVEDQVPVPEGPSPAL